MNGGHHEKMALVACNLLRLPGHIAAHIIAGSSAPDHAVDVFVRMPNGERVTKVLGREVAALKHFYPGWCWQTDPSLSVLEELGDLGAKALGMKVYGDSVPMVRALRAQTNATLCELRFPSAADCGGYFAAVANGDPFIIGEAGHMGADCCVPQHARGELLNHHELWENQAEKHCRQHLKMFELADDPDGDLLVSTMGKAVDAEKIDAPSIEELCRQNAAWALAWFKKKDLSECTVDDAIAVTVRGVATMKRTIELMTKGAT